MNGVVETIAALWDGLATFFTGFFNFFVKLGYAAFMLLLTPLTFGAMFVKLCVQYLQLILGIMPSFLTTYIYAMFIVRILKFIWHRSQGVSHGSGRITTTTVTKRPAAEKTVHYEHNISESERYK